MRGFDSKNQENCIALNYSTTLQDKQIDSAILRPSNFALQLPATRELCALAQNLLPLLGHVDGTRGGKRVALAKFNGFFCANFFALPLEGWRATEIRNGLRRSLGQNLFKLQPAHGHGPVVPLVCVGDDSLIVFFRIFVHVVMSSQMSIHCQQRIDGTCACKIGEKLEQTQRVGAGRGKATINQ